MGWRFRKSFKFAPGIRLNLGKKSSSISFGTKGFRTSFNTSGRNTTSFGIPGTGLYYSTSTSLKKKRKAKKNSKTIGKKRLKHSILPKVKTNKQIQNQTSSLQNVAPQYSARTYKVCGIIAIVIAVPIIILSLLIALVEPIGLIFTAVGIMLFVRGLFMKKKASTVDQQEENENQDAISILDK